MSSLFGGLSIALNALRTAQGELNTTSTNIANHNTPGYTRERAVVSEQPAIQLGNLEFGDGVDLQRIESVRDSVLEYRIGEETQQQSQLEAYLGPMQQAEAIFNEAQGTGLQSALTAFFNSFTALSADPTNAALRQGVLSSAQQLASGFNSAARNLSSIRTSIDQSVQSTVSDINNLTQQIATLNAKIGQAGAGADTNVLQDQRMSLIQQLSGEINISITDATDGTLTLTSANGTALVVGQQSMALTVQTDPTRGTQHVFMQNQDITSAVTAGKLGGLIQARDSGIAAMSNQLDQLAADLSNAVNAAHKSGYDQNGNTNQNLFLDPPAGVNGAALQMAVAITDPAQVAASSDGTPGDNRNAVALAKLQSQPIVNLKNPLDFYATAVSQMGMEISSASAEHDAQNLVLQQLQQQRSSISGVSLDEEAANLIKFQRAYEAAAQVVNILNSLTAVTINLGGGTAVS